MSERLRQMIAQSDNIVFFGGAGVSTESGIPDFRSVDGLYRQRYDYPPETILSRSFFERRPEDFFRFYREKLLAPQARPNKAHLTLAALEREGRLKAVVTQNIDGLHQAAGSQRVFELHGSVHRNHCLSCGRFYSLEEMLALDTVPRCACGGLVKPDVVLYEEPLPEDVFLAAMDCIRRADLLIVGGTSLSVYPAAALVDEYRGRKLVLINKTATAQDERAALCIREPIGEALSKAWP